MPNIITISEIKRRGMAALEEGLQRGPVHITKHNKPAAVVISETEYQRLISKQPAPVKGMTAMQWLLTQPSTGKREKADIDAQLVDERAW